MMQWHNSASDQLPPLWWKYVNLQFLPLCNSPTERASFSTSAPYFEQLLLLFFFFFATVLGTYTQLCKLYFAL